MDRAITRRDFLDGAARVAGALTLGGSLSLAATSGSAVRTGPLPLPIPPS